MISLETEFSENDDSDADKDYQPSESSSESDLSVEEIGEQNNNMVQQHQEANTPKQKGKKRVRRPHLHKREVLKRKRNSGKEYVSQQVVHRAKQVQAFDHRCRYECHKFSEEDRRAIFTKFWELNDWNLQTAFISSCAECIEPKRKIVGAANPKSKSVRIKLKGLRVCKMFFLKTLDISNGRYSRAVNKKTDTGFAATDNRGKAPCPKKIPENASNLVKAHIDAFPKYKSHYTRHYNPNKTYLPSHLNIKKMYECYVEYCAEQNEPPVKEWFYRRVFNTEFNIGFHQPLSDTCHKCDQLNISLLACQTEEEKLKFEAQKNIHQRKAEKGVQAKRAAKELARNSSDVVSVCFDLQKTLPTPQLTTNKVFYMRVLWTYNLGIHDLGKNCASMFMWDESKAKRGSLEVGSCLIKYVKSLPETTKHFIAFSDSCSGQNKNKNIVKFWMYIAKETQIETLDHKFLEPGHTYMECDEDFALIEKHKKHIPYIYVPNEWVEAVKKTSKKFSCYEMKNDDFFSLENIERYVIKDIKKDSTNSVIKWRDIKWIRVEKKKPFAMYFKYTLNEDVEFYSVDCSKHMPGRLPSIALSRLFTESVKIKYAKWKNLQELLPFIPPIHHHFFKELKHFQNEKSKTSKRQKPTVGSDIDENDRLLSSDEEV